MTLNAILTLLAIVTGPIIAVFLTWYLDRRHRAYDRRLDIFRSLMRTRGIRLDPEHVASLNVIELEFYNKPLIRQDFKSYIEHLSLPNPQTEADQNQFYDQRSQLLMELLQKIGGEVGYKFDKMELDKRSYVPVGWENDQFLQRKNAHLLSSVLSGERPIPITNFLVSSPYPDPPKPEITES